MTSVQYKMRLTKVIVIIVMLGENFSQVLSVFKLTNFQCTSLNQSWVVFHECRLRAIKRDVAVLNLNATILYPANTIIVTGAVVKKANGFKPFPMNFTVDCCAYQKKRNNPIATLIYNLYYEYTNMNHTCPYVGDQIIKGFYPKHELLHLPLPSGEYALLLDWYFHSQKVIITNVYFTFS